MIGRVVWLGEGEGENKSRVGCFMGEITRSLWWTKSLSTIPLEDSHLFKIIESV